MKKYPKIFAVMAVTTMLFSLAACGNTEAEKSTDDVSSQVFSEVEETVKPEQIDLMYAENFNIQYLEDGMKIVTDADGRDVLLLHKDQTAPAQYSELPTVTIPLSQAVYTSTTQVGFLRAFDDDTLFDSIVGVRQAAEDWDFDAMKTRMLNGDIVDIGSNTSSSVTYDYEIIQSLNPNLLFLSGGGMVSDEASLISMLDEAGILYLSDGSSRESDYKGTMEWLKFYAAFYDLDQEAEEYFDAAMDRIAEVTEKVKDQEKPKVGWAIVTGGQVYVEDAGSKTAQMVRDAGGEYLFDGIGDDTNSVTSISVEELYDRLSQGDILINRGMPKYGPDLKSITDQAPVLAELAIFKDHKVWQITDNFWSSYHNIDQKYLELAAIFYPELFPDVEFENFILMPDVAE